MKLSLLLTLCLLPMALIAHTGGEVEVACPLDGTKFKSWQDFSGTSFGARLDLKKNGPIAQPRAMAQCPKCHFPLYRKDFSEDEKRMLLKIVSSKRFVDESSGQSAYYALGIIKEELKEPPFQIAWAYLQASWEVEEKGEANYFRVVKQAIQWFDRAAVELSDSKEKKQENQLAEYLAIELSRRTRDFDGARKRLDAAASLAETEVEWLPGALRLEKQLIEAKDSSPHDIGEDEEKK